MKNLLILGSTGSIGVSTLDVVRRNPDVYQVSALAANRNIDLLLEQALEFKPSQIVISDDRALEVWHTRGFSERFRQATGQSLEVLEHPELNNLCASDGIDCIMAAIVGSAGLPPVLAGLRAGKTVFLANKEALVLGGQFVLSEARKSGARLLPVDSEHNAIFQCLPGNYSGEHADTLGVARLVLTASGGPFRNRPFEQMDLVTPDEAVAHPNWSMGRKISVDSATMANKGLELMEAFWLFGLPASRLSVLIHPQSIVHSMVEYVDGSVIAQMGCPDMRTPIAHVLGFPDRIQSGSGKLNLAQLAQLTFEEPDFRRFPMLKLAFQVLDHAEVLGPVFNAANEVAVDAFLNNGLKYTRIFSIVSDCLSHFSGSTASSLDAVFELDRAVRVYATGLLTR